MRGLETGEGSSAHCSRYETPLGNGAQCDEKEINDTVIEFSQRYFT